MLEARVKFWDLLPAQERLRDREPNEAFATAQAGRALVVYFTNGGSVEADLRGFAGACDVRWLDLAQVQWSRTDSAAGGDWTRLTAPAAGSWVALVEARGPDARPRSR
jgi:hypothetical protein